MISVKFTLIFALLSFIIGKILFSWYFIRHCVATDDVLFDNQKFLDDFVKKNQTFLHTIEVDSHFYLNRLCGLNQGTYVPHKCEEHFKQEYKKYLDFYEEIVQKYQDVFFYGYFKIINDKDGPEILQLLLDLHKNRTQVLSMSFKDKYKGPFDDEKLLLEVVAKNKEMQQSIALMTKTIIVYYQEMSEDYEEHKYSLTRNARWKGHGNYEICQVKMTDWLCKEVVEGAAIYALLRPHNRSYTIYFLSVLIGQFSEAYLEHSTYNRVIKEYLFENFLQKTGLPYHIARSRITEKDMMEQVMFDRIPYPAMVYSPFYMHFAIMTYCLTYIDKRKIIGGFDSIRQSIYSIYFNFLTLGHFMIIGFPIKIMKLGCQAMKEFLAFCIKIMKLGCQAMKQFLALCLLPYNKLKQFINKVRRVLTLMNELDNEEPPTEEIPHTEEVNVKKDDNQQTKLEHFECPICMEVMEAPLQIFSCTNGHLVCSDCLKSGSLTACPMCREDFKKHVPKRRPKMEELLVLILDK